MRPGPSSRGNSNAALFEEFHESWLVRQEYYLDELLTTKEHCHESRDDDLKDIINRVLLHYQQYYEEKSRFAQREAFRLFSPNWFTSFEHTFLWITGFKPALAFRVLSSSVNDLSNEQEEGIRRLRAETRVEERMLNDDMAKIHESVAAPPLEDLAEWRSCLEEGEEAVVLEGKEKEEERVIGTLKSAVETVVVSADTLRTTTLAKVVDILNPMQNVKFLTALTEIQLRIRSLGLQIDAERQDSNGY